eukprot:3216867-Pyramimonas_sp.AAC.1
MRDPDPGELVDCPPLEFAPHSWLEIFWPAGGQHGNGAALETMSRTAGLLPRERLGNRIFQDPPFDPGDGDARGGAVPQVVV